MVVYTTIVAKQRMLKVLIVVVFPSSLAGAPYWARESLI